MHTAVETTSVDVAVSLADEGVPIRAIARATRIPSQDVYELLENAIAEGKLLSLPKDDWPPGLRRSQRQQSETSILGCDDDTLRMVCSSRFVMTRLQAAVFVTILRRPELSKENIHNAIEAIRTNQDNPTDQKMVDVVVCHIRKKLNAVDNRILITTIWGVGYSLAPAARDLALALLTAHMHTLNTQAQADLAGAA
jgi:hypothetical protein